MIYDRFNTFVDLAPGSVVCCCYPSYKYEIELGKLNTLSRSETLCTRSKIRVLRHRSLLHVTLRNKVTIVWPYLTSIVSRALYLSPIVACVFQRCVSSLVNFDKTSRRYNDSTVRQQLPLLTIWLLETSAIVDVTNAKASW